MCGIEIEWLIFCGVIVVSAIVGALIVVHGLRSVKENMRHKTDGINNSIQEIQVCLYNIETKLEETVKHIRIISLDIYHQKDTMEDIIKRLQ